MFIGDVDVSQYDVHRTPEHCDNFGRWFAPLLGRPAKVLELGIQNGGSLLMWRDLFPGGHVAGLDLNPSPVHDPDNGITAYKGFQQDTSILDRIGREVAPEGFDIIIDDASHTGLYTLQSFQHLFYNHLKPGGLYILDDWYCAYWTSWSDGHQYKGTTAYGPLADAPRIDSESLGTVERFRRKARANARPVARWLSKYSAVSDRLTSAYQRADGLSVKRRFPSHDWGMAGALKEIIDAVAVEETTYGGGTKPPGASTERVIHRIEVTLPQALIVKTSDATRYPPMQHR